MFNPLDLVFIGLLMQVGAVVVSFLPRNDKTANAGGHLILCGGLLVGLVATVYMLAFPQSCAADGLVSTLSVARFFRFDSLALYFLAIIQLVAIPTTIYSYSYMGHYQVHGRSTRGLFVFYTLLLIFTQILVIANHAIVFLGCWEMMTAAAYLGMVFEKEKAEVQRGSFYYIVAGHVIAFVLYIFFFLLHHATGSWFFSDFHLTPGTGLFFVALYLSGMIGFGIKAGFIPFHFWLPQAHPIAPTVFSSFLSGIIIKTGIYGIFRMFQFVNPAPVWLGWTVLVMGLISAIFGVWYALAQHDIKRLLAYHSVENIGIIGIGIGIGFIGSANHSVAMQMLGFGGALLHTLNHAVFKSLLFLGSGVIQNNRGTRNIEDMGGIVHKNRLFVVMFLIGSVAISGIPPLNGFVSEFLIYKGLFKTSQELAGFFPLFMLIAVVGLALVGGLAVACFTKINAIMFLGTPRKPIHSFTVSVYEHISMGMLAVLCLGIGLYPQPVLSVINSVLHDGFVVEPSHEFFLINWSIISAVFFTVVGGIAVLLLVRVAMVKRFGSRRSAAWGCGYTKLSARMQYTASSFADELNTIAAMVLGYRKTGRPHQTVFAARSDFAIHSADLIDSGVVVPLFKWFANLMQRIVVLVNPDIRYYIAYILVMIVVYGLVAFIWF